MAVRPKMKSRGAARLLARTTLASPVAIALLMTQPAYAQTRVVSACTGVSLPPSVVTGIIAPIVTGITGPTETTVNGILGLPLLSGLLPRLTLNATGLLNQAAAGQPITLQALASDGTVIGPADQCRLTADAITLDTPGGVAIGGNQITGLGANGRPAFASDIDAIAFGNNARAEPNAIASLAFGANSSVTAANSVALGAGSVAGRGALTGYVATGLAGTQSSAGEVSIGAPGALRQLTNVAPGSAATDAATVGQVDGVLAQVTALGDAAVRYDDSGRSRVTLAGAAGTTIGNLAPGALTATSSEGVNGSQLFATNQRVDANAAAIAALGTGGLGPVRYATAAAPTVPNGGTITDEVTLVGTGAGPVGLHNVRGGALVAGSTDAVNGDQLTTTNQALAGLTTRVGTSETAIGGLDTRVTGNTDAIAGLDTRVTANTSGLAALDAVAVRYDAADRVRVTFGGTGGTVLDNVAAGLLGTGSLQAVNGGQLFATNTQVAANTAAIAGLGAGAAGPVRYSTAAAPTVPNGGTVTDDVTVVGTGGGAVGLHNVRDGTLAAGSTDAVTGGQLFATNQAVAGNTTAIANLDNRVATTETQIAGLQNGVATNNTAVANLTTQLGANSTAITNLNTQVGANTTAITTLQTQVASQPLRYADAATPTVPNGGAVSDDATLAGAAGGAVGLHNVRAGVLAAGSTDAVNGGQLAATNAQVATNTTAITVLTGTLTGATVSPVQYSNPATPTVPNGGTLTNDVTLVGANPVATVAIHNVAGGAVTAASTDAVNGQQLYAVAQTAANGVQYDRDAAGARTNRVTLAGGNPGAPVAIANVAAGTLGAGSTDAVNGGQLYATQQIAQQAATISANSVQYDAGRTAVTLGAAAGPPVAVHNVAAGVAATDAVNVGQLQAGMQGMMADVASAMDARMGVLAEAVNFDLRNLKREVGAGTSSAMAVAALPQATEPGRTMIAIGGGTYRGQSAVAFGASTFLPDGHSILRLGATYDSRGKGGANAGFGYQF